MLSGEWDRSWGYCAVFKILCIYLFLGDKYIKYDWKESCQGVLPLNMGTSRKERMGK